MSVWIQAGLWGLVGGSALLMGAAVGYLARVPQRVIAGIMAFGGGVLISALSFNLMDEAYASGGFLPTAAGFLAGGAVYTLVNGAIACYGAKHRKRSERQPSEDEHEGSGLAIALGSLMDGVPESIVIGLSVGEGGAVSIVTVAAVFLSNIPEALSSSSGMRKAGRSARYIFGVWGSIAALCGVSAVLGATLFGQFSSGVLAATTAVAAGAILTMLADTMIPEAFEQTHNFTGLLVVLGFLIAFLLAKQTA
jgi:ZIP family zinc transporter